jgi:hypothetical protein
MNPNNPSPSMNLSLMDEPIPTKLDKLHACIMSKGNEVNSFIDAN